ncbi:MAG: hypothetical protein ACYC3X_07905 [Pirellulaceae bacterium]
MEKKCPAVVAADERRDRSPFPLVFREYDRVASPEVTYSTIGAEVKKLDKPFTKDEIFEIARGIGIQGSLKTKRAALDEIHRRMTERKESSQRTQF